MKHHFFMITDFGLALTALLSRMNLIILKDIRNIDVRKNAKAYSLLCLVKLTTEM